MSSPQTSTDTFPVSFAPERWAVALLLLACVAFSLIRIDPTDTPTHLATAREFFRSGEWIKTNTFSYTYPDYPVYQQYPIYQTLLYLVHQAAGFEGLSVLTCLTSLTILVLWIRWAGSWRWACLLSPIWAIALLGFRERITLRPDLLTMLLLILMLHLVERYRNSKTIYALGMVALQWLMVNSHQLFPLGLAVQSLWVVHLLVVRQWGGRWGLSDQDARLPLLPTAGTLFFSFLACLTTPIGWRIILVPFHTATSLAVHQQRIQEFASVFGSIYLSVLFGLTGLLALYGFWLNRRSWSPFEIGLWLLGLALGAAAVRSLFFATFFSVALFSRNLARYSLKWDLSQVNAFLERSSVQLARLAAAGLTIAFCMIVFLYRWITPARGLGGPQPGLGRTLGNWPDHALQFLRDNPPPGRMFNMTFYTGNTLIWGLYPQQQVWFDPRFESYPRAFILEALKAESDPELMDRLLREWDARWIVTEVRHPGCRKQVARLLAANAWQLVHADTVFLILVRNTPDNQEYLSRHRLKPQDISPNDWLTDQPDLLEQQKRRMADLFNDLGLPEKAAELLPR